MLKVQILHKKNEKDYEYFIGIFCCRIAFSTKQFGACS